MAVPSFDIFTLLIYFVYGLAFFGMGLALALEANRSPSLVEARLLRPLAIFGIIHGIHEWLDSYLLQLIPLGFQIPIWLLWLRVALLSGSFGFLLVYGLKTLIVHPLNHRHNTLTWTILLIYEIVFTGSAIFSFRK